MCTGGNVEYVPSGTVGCGYQVEMLTYVPSGNVEYVPSGSVEYEFQVEMLKIYQLEMLNMYWWKC